MRKKTIQLEMLACDLESRFGSDDHDVVEVKRELAKRVAVLSTLGRRFPQERRVLMPSRVHRLGMMSLH